ncbi:hypothetical protein BDZ85DRAFT_268354 [Elsinoe ampelina]|uniref:Aminoglycoside phosphotransferase domain-containing protein n=1 Tax=Elsinoe ampelina TaxID=302913 RepID=A0A6A6G247_9PEZI|nr:hypothetical protein BDZ85DRAFT_268354 [Elsinoe ampelina]
MSDFFSVHPEMTIEVCIARAESITGQKVSALHWQGYHSCTLQSEGGQTVVQFRSEASPLDQEVMDLARNIHGRLVPKTTRIISPQSETFTVWEMEKLRGVGFLAIVSSDQIDKMVKNTVQDMADFFADAWEHPHNIACEKKAAFAKRTSAILGRLAANLPASLQDHAKETASKLSEIIEVLPWVLTHGDLSSMNILVDSDSAHLEGVVDWAEAEILPFGIGLWGFEDILGYADAGGWHWINDDQGHESRCSFIRSLLHRIGPVDDKTLAAIETARTLGLLLRYGSDGEDPSPTTERLLGELLDRTYMQLQRSAELIPNGTDRLIKQ